MKYWAYVNNEILGPFEREKLLELPSFSPSLLVCPQTPVGEKTEDWKEASTYAELSASKAQPAQAPAAASPEFSMPAPKAQEALSPAAEPFSQPPAETPSLNFKPLTASRTVEPVPPAEHFEGMNIAVNRLGKAGGEPAATLEPQQASSSFDPISLSRIERRSESLSGEENPGAAAGGISLEPQGAFPQPAAVTEAAPVGELKFQPGITMPETPASVFTPAASAAPEIETFARPITAPAAATPIVTDLAGLEVLVQRLDALSKSAATRQDITSTVEPLRLKLDQMGEVISSIKNSQFQHEVMSKLTYLENTVGELKESFKTAQQTAAKFQKAEAPKNSDTVFGVNKPKPMEAPKSEPAKDPGKPAEITDQGSKPSRIIPVLKKLGKFIVTLVLLAAVLLGAVIGLKNFGVFDATKFIPFPLPFIAAPKAQPVAEPEQPQPDKTAEQKEPAQPAPEPQEEQQATKKAAQAEPEAAPEIIYITRTYKLTENGQNLESKIDAHSVKAGGTYSRTKWEVKPAGDGMFEISALVPGKPDDLTYTYLVDRVKKTVQPANETGKAAFDALAGDAAKKPTARKAGKQKAAPKPAAKAASKAQPKKSGKKAPTPDEEYEYEYVEDDGTGQQ